MKHRNKKGKYVSLEKVLELWVGCLLILLVFLWHAHDATNHMKASLQKTEDSYIGVLNQQLSLTDEVVNNSTTVDKDYWTNRALKEKNSLQSLTIAEQAIIKRESNFNPEAKNAKSTAAGLCQLLDYNRVKYAKLAGVKNPNTKVPEEQIAMCRQYIAVRYGTDENALSFHLANGYF